MDTSIRENVYDFLLSESTVMNEGDKILLNDNRIDDVKFYSKIIKDYLESYFNVLVTMMDLKEGRREKKELILDIKKNGIRRYHLGEIHLAESLSIINYNNAIKRFIDEKILTENYNSDKGTELEIIDLEKARSFYNKIKSYLENIV